MQDIFIPEWTIATMWRHGYYREALRKLCPYAPRCNYPKGYLKHLQLM